MRAPARLREKAVRGGAHSRKKEDRQGADPKGVISEIARRFCVSCPNCMEIGTSRIPEELAEALAEQEEILCDSYLDGERSLSFWLPQARAAVKERRIFPTIYGSALLGTGIQQLLTVLAQLAPDCSGSKNAPFSARVYKVRHDKQGGKILFLKVTDGSLKPKEFVSCREQSGQIREEKVNELRQESGGKFQSLEQAGPGDLCAVIGPLLPRPGDWVGYCPSRFSSSSFQPLLEARAIFEPTVPSQTAFSLLQLLEEEDPLLSVGWDPALEQLSVRVMGPIQLEVLTQVIKQRFGLAVAFGQPQILYLETLSEPTLGCGHFEPLRHYAEVHLLLSPGSRGSGVCFESRCSTDELGQNWQNLIRTHVLEKGHVGTLTGSPVTDLQVTLLAGRAHLKHTEGGDFRQAVYRALRQGLMSGKPLLLEPYYTFSIRVEPAFIGRVMADLQRMHADSQPLEQTPGQAVIQGQCPAATMMGYAQQLTAVTKGKSAVSLAFSGYRSCHNAQQVIAEKGYEPEHDLENPCGSVFCSHGAGFSVSWKDAPRYMHLKPEKSPSLF